MLAFSNDGLFLSLGLLLICYIVYQRYYSPLARFPGPFLASFTNLWKLWTLRTGRYDRVILELHQQLGDFVRIGPNEVVIAQPDAIKQIYNTVDGKGFGKVIVPIN